MRHGSATNNFGRTPAHRNAMLRNLAINLLQHGRIRTTVQKAKAVRPLVEKLISLGKKGKLHHRRLALSELGSTLTAKRIVKKVFGEIAPVYKDRNGGYTRIVKLPAMIRLARVDAPKVGTVRRSKFYGTRQGDNADLALFELVEAEVSKEKKHRKPVRRTTRKMRGETAPAKGAAKASEKAAPAAEGQAKAETPAETKPETPAAQPQEPPKESPGAQPQTPNP